MAEKEDIQRQVDMVMTQIFRELLLQKRYPFGIPPRGYNDKKASGNLVNSIKIQNSYFDKDLTTLTYDIDGPVGSNGYSYFRVVDKGRMRGRQQPPIQPIFNWLKKRGIRGKDKKGRFIKDLSLAYAISGGIKKKGIRATNVKNLFEIEIYQNPKFFQLYKELFGIEFTDTIDNVKLD